ncbi:mannose-binding protein C-like [Penaeus monodon]|uniref:mannose-binding protein C-like n=1 Tax=Penaeus monodon TaxID=6687 RepID=UPI0018A7B39F|nr:mannose-binding protein C-like [Penaeus monodon]
MNTNPTLIVCLSCRKSSSIAASSARRTSFAKDSATAPHNSCARSPTLTSAWQAGMQLQLLDSTCSGQVTSKGFLRYGDKAYRHFASSKTHWDARNSCWNVNASLAVPLNAGENAFLASLVNTGTFWILADDATTEGVWVNTDTSDPLPYARWIVGQPDNAGGTEDCAEITYQALWNDLPCTLSRYYACEIPVAQCDQLKDDIRCSYLL